MEAQVIEERSPAKAARVLPLNQPEPVSLPSCRLYELFEQRARQTPDATALVFGNVELTYAQLNESANQLAHYLRHMGVGPGVLVGICMHRRPEMIIAVPIEPGERPSPPNLSASLKNGREVRLTRGTFSGMVGHVTGFPKELVSLDNGLRVACAQVELVTGEKINVPLANIEVSG